VRTDDIRVLRGGSWPLGRIYARAVALNDFPPAIRVNRFGFRVVCSVRPPPLSDH
jgi:formylglycine-generating enzyme required for sulfatase activity